MVHSIPILPDMPQFGLIVCFIAFCSAVSSGDDAKQSVPTEPRTAPVDEGTQERTDPRSRQTAEDLLRALQADRPPSEIIIPASRASIDPATRDAHLLLPEGTAVVERRGRLVRQGSGWDFLPDDGRPMTVLPNAQLEVMVALQENSGSEMRFVVSGEAMVFKNLNFLLIRQALRDTSEAAKPEPIAAAESVAVPADASVEDVLSALENQRPVDSELPDNGLVEGMEDLGSSSGQGMVLDGSLVVRQPGRLLHENSRWIFVFDDKIATGRSAVALLPNQSLEIMIHGAESGPGGLVFIVSGEMTQYGPENHLLVRGVTRVFDLGNLRP